MGMSTREMLRLRALAELQGRDDMVELLTPTGCVVNREVLRQAGADVAIAARLAVVQLTEDDRPDHNPDVEPVDVDAVDRREPGWDEDETPIEPDTPRREPNWDAAHRMIAARPTVTASAPLPVIPEVEKISKSLRFYINREKKRGWTCSAKDAEGLVAMAREAARLALPHLKGQL